MKLRTLICILLTIGLYGCASNDPLRENTVEEKKAEVYYNQGTSDLIKKNYQAALTNLLHAKELNPKDSKTRTNLGMAYYFREQTAFAISELKEAISIDKQNTDAKQNLATIYLEKNNLKEAKELYEDALKDLTYSALFRIHYNLAMLSLKVGDRKNAFEELFLALKEKEDYCLAHYKLGELYSEEYKYKDAFNSFQEGTKGTCVNMPEIHFAVANALINLNRLGEAKIKLQQIIDKFPKTNFKSLAINRMKNMYQEMPTEHSEQSENELNKPLTETPKF